MFAIVQTVHTLCILLLEFSVYPFDTLQLSFRHIEDVHEDFLGEKNNFNNFTAF